MKSAEKEAPAELAQDQVEGRQGRDEERRSEAGERRIRISAKPPAPVQAHAGPEGDGKQVGLATASACTRILRASTSWLERLQERCSLGRPPGADGLLHPYLGR